MHDPKIVACFTQLYVYLFIYLPQIRCNICSYNLYLNIFYYLKDLNSNISKRVKGTIKYRLLDQPSYLAQIIKIITDL